MLGVVWFSTSAERIANLTEITDSSRAELLDSIPTVAGGYTSIASGKNPFDKYITFILNLR